MQSQTEVNVITLPDGRLNVTASIPMTIAGVEIECDKYRIDDPTFLHPTVTPARRKVASSRWLLRKLELSIKNEGAALMFLELLVSNLRSVTFALQKAFDNQDGFADWYAVQQSEMRSDPQMRWLIEARNQAEKEGLVLGEFGPRCIQRFFRDGRIVAESAIPSLAVCGVAADELFSNIHYAIEKLHRVVEAAHERFLADVEPRRAQFTLEYVRERPDGAWEHFDPI